jgi:hypothetical protein
MIEAFKRLLASISLSCYYTCSARALSDEDEYQPALRAACKERPGLPSGSGGRHKYHCHVMYPEAGYRSAPCSLPMDPLPTAARLPTKDMKLCVDNGITKRMSGVLSSLVT